MANNDGNNASIDHFTDYISGNIHQDDRILLLGNDHTLFFHQKELDEIAKLIDENEETMLTDLENTITQRIDPSLL